MTRRPQTRDVEPGLRAMAQRSLNAENDFIETLMNFGEISMEEAEKVFRIYQKAKVLKVDAVGGTIRVKHGALLDRETIRLALEESD